MCRKILIGLVLAGLAIMALGSAIFQYTGWPGFLAYLVVLLVGLILLKGMLPRILRYFLLARLRKMSKGLHKAIVSRTSFSPAPDPSADHLSEPLPAIGDPEAASREDLSWNWVEVTVEPPKGDEPWSLANLSLGQPKRERAAMPEGVWKILASFVDDQVITSSIERWDGNRFVPADLEMVKGPQRLRFHVGFGKDVQALSLYYFHMIEIAEIPIPRLRIQADAES
jgi:hypothetical protein